MDWHEEYLWWKNDVRKHTIAWAGAILLITSPIPLIGSDIYQRTTNSYSSEKKIPASSKEFLYTSLGMGAIGCGMMLYGSRKKE